MSISSVNSNIRINDLSQDNKINPTTDQPIQDSQISKPGISPQELSFGASALKSKLLSTLAQTSNSQPTTPPRPPALDPRGVFPGISPALNRCVFGTSKCSV
jgi:hypothetical protein